MKNILFGALFMLMGTFAFANNSMLIQDNGDISIKPSNISYSITPKMVVDCLLTLTIVYEDGTTETVYYLIKGKSCKEVFGD